MAAVNQYGELEMPCVCVWESYAAKGACFVRYSNENHELALVFNPCIPIPTYVCSTKAKRIFTCAIPSLSFHFFILFF